MALSNMQIKSYPKRTNHLELSNGDNSLLWFHTIHSEESENPMFDELETKINNFKPDLVLVEGGYNNRRDNDRTIAIMHGESSFAAFCANKHNIQVEDIEPVFSEQIKFLQNKYKPYDILSFFIVRQIGSIQLKGTTDKHKLDKLMISITNSLLKNGLIIDSSSVNAEKLMMIVNSIISKPINHANWKDSKLYREYAGKRNADNVLYHIYKDITEYRNTHIVNTIRNKRETYKRIFIVMGYGHLEATKKELQYLYSK